MPFIVPVPIDAAPSFDISPVEMSLLEVKYFVEVVITEKDGLNRASSFAQTGNAIIRSLAPIDVVSYNNVPPIMDEKHE